MTTFFAVAVSFSFASVSRLFSELFLITPSLDKARQFSIELKIKFRRGEEIISEVNNTDLFQILIHKVESNVVMIDTLLNEELIERINIFDIQTITKRNENRPQSGSSVLCPYCRYQQYLFLNKEGHLVGLVPVYGIEETCAICLDNPVKHLLKCSHFVACDKCLISMITDVCHTNDPITA